MIAIGDRSSGQYRRLSSWLWVPFVLAITKHSTLRYRAYLPPYKTEGTSSLAFQCFWSGRCPWCAAQARVRSRASDPLSEATPLALRFLCVPFPVT